MNIELQKSLVSEWYMGFTHRDGDRFVATLADNAVIRAVGNSPFSGTFEGKATIQAAVAPLFAAFEPCENPETDTEWKIMVADGIRVVGMMAVNWKSAATGADYPQRYCQVFEFDGDKISGIWEFFDTALIQTALAGNALSNPETPVEKPLSF